eukprot:1600781-Prymnesium_polylepis.1
MNDETMRKYLQSVKRLLTFGQRVQPPTGPSKQAVAPSPSWECAGCPSGPPALRRRIRSRGSRRLRRWLEGTREACSGVEPGCADDAM